MEQIIKETTEKLSKGTITLDEANKIHSENNQNTWGFKILNPKLF